MKTDIVLVKANNQKKIFQDLSKDLSGKEPPLWIILTAAFLREKGFTVSVIDAEAENLDVKETVKRAMAFDPLLVSVIVSGTNPSASTINMPSARDVLAGFRDAAPQVIRAIGGLHPSALPERTLREEPADFLFKGEGFRAHAELLDELKSGKSRADDFSIKGLWQNKSGNIVPNPDDPNIEDLGELPMAAWDLLPMDRYRAHNWHCFGHIEERNPYAVIYTSLGCPFRCGFCCINAIFGGPGIRYRPPVKVIEEVDYLVKNYGVKNIKVLDELFAMNWRHVEEICDGLIELGHELNLWVYGRVDTVKPFMLEKMKKAGINWIAYGFEAGSKKVRDGVSKGRFDQDQIKEIVKMTHKAGINIVANFIFGLPDDDKETMQETLDLAKELNCAYANLYCAMAYPGSQLYNDAVEQGLALPKDWSAYSQFSVDSLPLPTKHLSSGEVLKFRDLAFDDYHADPKYLNMIKEKFGEKTLENITTMCSVKLKRNNYEYNDNQYFSNTGDIL
ncbi:MAG: B12-binding domain-containing radical SAM protein [Omnitrophica WOR_2 bacterium RIFOXYA12_FULL_38_10]|nr:MAG: B12-binding domain-containing radical SAM protein [Omnitrophica WOR_2 bacterium RIFOXYA12_FULL_38_10]